MSKQYLIFENGQPMDGIFYDDMKALGDALRYADADARVFEFDDVEPDLTKDCTDDAASWAAKEFGDWAVIDDPSELPPFLQAHMSDREAMAWIEEARAVA